MSTNSNNLSPIRHSLAHLLAAAVLEHYPRALPTIGPAVDNGFYYDFDFGTTDVGEDDLKKIQKSMRKMLGKWDAFVRIEVTADEARTFFKDNEYKLELIDEIEKEGGDITLYYSGPRGGVPEKEELFNPKFVRPNNSFIDLCRGGHVDDPSKEIEAKAFELARVAGAYWRGDEGNTMLTRIYGLAFGSKDELNDYKKQLEEAKKRDHRKLGKELGLFTFSELVGPGLPLWTPKGTIFRTELDNFIWELRKEKGYERVTIPHITKPDLYKTSGHWDKFADELFRVSTREEKAYAMKPMNCPHHTQIYAHKTRSYRDLPQRYAETTMVYRDEQSGELSGLTRVLSITQDDAHVFTRHSQVKEEFFAIWDIVDRFYGAFDFDLSVRLSFHEPDNMEKYLGTEEVWREAEDTLRSLAKERGSDHVEASGEAAMYGPKIDFMATDSIGREHQVATIQLDLNMPQRFGLTCVNEEGEDEEIVMIHAAIMGSIERFSAVVIEHLAGKFPLWLAPVQVRVLPIGEDHHEYARVVTDTLKETGIRAELDESGGSLGRKIRDTKMEKIPYFLVIGDNEVEAKEVTLESRDRGNEGTFSIEKLVKKLRDEIKSRQLSSSE